MIRDALSNRTVAGCLAVLALVSLAGVLAPWIAPHEPNAADVINALPANNGQVGGNVMDVGREQFLVRGLGLLKSTADIGAIVLKAEDGVPVYLRDVAAVTDDG